MSKQLIRRLQSVIARWPVDSSRKGRDLGEFLATSYLQKFKELANNDVRSVILYKDLCMVSSCSSQCKQKHQ